MTDKEAARLAIAGLVEKFRDTPKATRDGYNEDETRHFFILPLFRALGWDTSSPADMSAEEQISRGFVDFGFYLNGVPAFYLETKRVREDLEKDEFIRQAVNYAYLKGVTWAVLTDFEGLHIYNAEWETNIPAQARYLMLGWEEYAEGDFNDLWLLSKPAMQERLLDKAATKHGKKARRAPVTELLFKNMTDWRGQLFNQLRFLSGQIWGANVREIDNAVQRLLDRLIFLRTVEDRGLEPPRLKEIVRQNEKSPGKIWPKLLELFTEMNEVYNSNLFAPAQLDLLNLHDPDLIRGIINDLYKYAGVEFDFNAISADVLGAVYEQYLGFRALDLESRDEMKGKQEKRKKQGIYYTPQYIVRYIVQQTVGRLLEDGADPHALRIVDPACGSGSFLIEAFDVLDRWLATHEKHIPAGERRRRILTENLYGVDLDEQAVEVTRLNLLLRASLERGKLPLLTNIQRGNSLIEDPAVAGEAAFVWETAFPEVFEAGGFDAVIGNPPYVPVEEMSESEKLFYRERYSVFERKFDTSVIFIMRSLALLRTKGLLGFISSVTWQTGENYAKVREKIFSTYGVVEIVNLPFDIFADAYVDTGIYVLTNAVSSSYRIFVFPKKQEETKLEGLSFSEIPTELSEPPGYKLVINLYANLLLRKIVGSGSTVALGAISISTQGLARNRFALAKRRNEEYSWPFLEKGQLNRYELNISQLAFTDPLSIGNAIRFYNANPKLLIRRIISRSDRILATFTAERLLFTKDINPFIITDSTINPLYVLGIVNSTLFSYLYLSTSSIATKDDFRQTTLAELRQLPIRTINADDPADVARHDQIVGLVEEMIALKQRMAEPQMSFSDERFIVAKRIEDVDRAIDALVYELYGLTDDEIALVEGTA